MTGHRRPAAAADPVRVTLAAGGGRDVPDPVEPDQGRERPVRDRLDQVRVLALRAGAGAAHDEADVPEAMLDLRPAPVP